MSVEFEKWWTKQISIYKYDGDVAVAIMLNCEEAFESGRASMLEDIRAKWPNDEEIFKASDMTGRGYDPTWMDACDWLKQNLFEEK
jgi:hypothetical protein